MKGGNILVFAPHPDDETLGCGGTIAKKTDEGYEVFVIVMTDGRHSFSKGLGIVSDPTPDQIKHIREEEVRKATKILGVKEDNLLLLDFVDGMLRENEKGAEEEIVKILSKTSPVEVYFPFEKDCHIDHKVTNRLVRRSIRKLGIRPLEYRYTIMHRYARIGPAVETFLSFFRGNAIHVDISKYMAVKKSALEEFKSELSIISNTQIEPRSRNLLRFLRRYERFYS